MNPRTVDWSAGRPAHDAAGRAEGLRERKKRLMRQQLSDTATEMFVERGFEAVRVAEVAAACGVSEKTVFNYFPTKESLVLDLPEVTMAALRTELARPDRTPVDAALAVLEDELGALTSWLEQHEDPARAAARLRQFGAMILATPSLRAHQRDMTDQLVAAAAETLAERAGAGPEDPEPQIAATALLGLWPIQFRALRTHLDGTRTPAQVRAAVTADVLRAANLLAAGLDGWAPTGTGPTAAQR
ncbi:TetR/AcrR family transcriptional regulator [Kitasatospora sp. NBC_00240]|uniref:TetR family transcriptional regulator n=1 Tax=Kitasatospora sp. NBC_00240 TaxID=2903567 RepID=UPI00225B4108|nr:TetR family transcriptional regulator [Kitasatospora sp. NBC_00240]MCX5208021.1 TetR/AcrR family transcriptional regulator [Kitasatospora sp. NBC_00240]